MRCKTVLNVVRSRDCTCFCMSPRPLSLARGEAQATALCSWWGLHERGLGGDVKRALTHLHPSCSAFRGQRLSHGSDVQTWSMCPQGREWSGLLILNPVPGVTMRTPRVQTAESSGRTLSSCVPSRKARQEGSGVRLAEFQGLFPSPGLALYNPTRLEHGWGFYMKK